ncbi:VOC family protein [Maricaulis maris]|uniref:VOC family protein n=1 Tax=Maricaulis maris TaxID=74318 RepID=UPI003B8E6AB4
MTTRVTRSTYVLAVNDLESTARWWVEKLGFEHWLRADGWAFLRRDNCYLRIGHCVDAIPPSRLGDHQFFAYVELEDVRAFHDEIKGPGVDIIHRLTDQPWGMREFGVQTPDGHRILFAQNIQ